MRRFLPTLLAGLLVLAPDAAPAQTKWHSLALGRVILDAPVAWVAARDADGGFEIVEPGAARWKLRVESEQLAVAAGNASRRVDEVAEDLKGRLLDRFGGAAEVSDFDIAEKIVAHSYTTAEGAVRIDVQAWHRIALGDTAIVIAHFTYAVAAALAEEADIDAARTLAERLVLGAELNPLAVPYRPAAPMVQAAPETR